MVSLPILPLPKPQRSSRFPVNRNRTARKRNQLAKRRRRRSEGEADTWDPPASLKPHSCSRKCQDSVTMGAAWVDVFRWSANIGPSNATGVRGERVYASQTASFRRTKQGFAVLPWPANVRKYDDLHQSGYPNYQLHYLGSGLHFSCPNPKRAADGSSSRRLFEKNGLRLFCVALCGAGILPDVFRLPSYGFPTRSFA